MALPALGEVHAHWSFDAAASGGKYADESGRSNHITVSTAPYHITSDKKFGDGALDFYAQNEQFLTLPGDGGTGAMPIVNSSFSVSLWMKRESLREEWAIGQGTNEAANTTLHLGFRAPNHQYNPDQFSFGFWSDDLHHTDTPTDLTQWHHYAMSYDAYSHVQRIVLDGDIANAQTRTTTSSGGYHFKGSADNDFWIGCRTGNAGWYDGKLDEVWVMNHVLSNRDIVSLYHNNSMAPIPGVGANGVLAHWSFDDPPTGGAHKDSSGRGQDIWDVTAPTHVTSDKVFGDGALDFESDNNEYLRLGGRGGLDVLGLQSNSFTISFWVKRETNNVESFVISQGDDGVAAESLHLGFRADDRVTLDFWSNNGLNKSHSSNQDTNNWHHYVMSYDASIKRQRIVIDGDVEGEAFNTANGHLKGSGNNDFWIGRRRDGRYFDGLIDEVWVLNRVVTDIEIKNLYQSNRLVSGGTVLIVR